MKDSKDVISEFNEYVNMTASELEKWLKSGDSNSAGWPKDDGEGSESVGHDSGRKIVEILKANPDKDPEKYTNDQVQHMRKVASYCKRHLAQESASNNEKDPEEVKMTKSYASLKNWGHDFLKGQGKAGSGKKNGSKKQEKDKAEEKEEEEEEADKTEEENGKEEEKAQDEEEEKDDGEKNGGTRRKTRQQTAAAKNGAKNSNGKKQKKDDDEMDVDDDEYKEDDVEGADEEEEEAEEEEDKEQEDADKKAGDKRKKNGQGQKNGASKKRQTAKGKGTKTDDAEDGQDDDQEDEEEEKDQQQEDDDGGDADDGDDGGDDSKKSSSKEKSSKKGPKKGETVSWSWGSGNPKGKVLDVKEEKTSIETKNGNEVSRDGDSEDPAVVLDTGKSKAIKSAHELN